MKTAIPKPSKQSIIREARDYVMIAVGMIIALPLTTLMLSYYQRFIINKEKIKYEAAEITDNQEINHKEIK